MTAGAEIVVVARGKAILAAASSGLISWGVELHGSPCLVL